MIVSVHQVVTSRHILACPGCDAQVYPVDHLCGQTTSFGPWLCDQCGVWMRGSVAGWTFTVEPLAQARLEVHVLRMYGADLLVRCWVGNPDGSEPDWVGQSFAYEESTCPTNVLPQVVAVVRDGQVDPHRIWSFAGRFQVDPVRMRTADPNELDAYLSAAYAAWTNRPAFPDWLSASHDRSPTMAWATEFQQMPARETP